MTFPQIRTVVLDTADVRELAEFYRELFGLTYRAGDEESDDPDWLVLLGDGGIRLAFQLSQDVPVSTWPDGTHPQMLHLDTVVGSIDELRHQHERALALGATLLLDRSDDPEEELYVYADLSGHLTYRPARTHSLRSAWCREPGLSTSPS